MCELFGRTKISFQILKYIQPNVQELTIAGSFSLFFLYRIYLGTLYFLSFDKNSLLKMEDTKVHREHLKSFRFMLCDRKKAIVRGNNYKCEPFPSGKN